MWGHGSDTSEGQHKPLPDSKSAGALTVDFPVSKARGHKAALIIKQPVSGAFVLILEGGVQSHGF